MLGRKESEPSEPMRIRFLCDVAGEGLCAQKGDVMEITRATAKDLIKAKIAELTTEHVHFGPPDSPGRDPRRDPRSEPRRVALEWAERRSEMQQR